MKQTEHYNLDLYEPNDLANLTDGYNNSMQILDTGMQALKDLTESYDERITTADTTANNALSLAQTNEKDIATLDSEMAGTADSGLKTLITTNADSIAAETARAEAAELVNKNSIEANKSDADSKFSGESDSGLKGMIDSNTKALKDNLAFNVKDYGALGDGVTDDTDAFRNAITAAATYVSSTKNNIFGGNVNGDWNANIYIPSGKYIIKGNLNIPTSNDLVDSNDKRVCGINIIGQNMPVIDFNNSNAGFTVSGSFFTMRNIQIQNADTAILVDVNVYTPYWIIDNCIIKNCTNGIKATNGFYMSIFNHIIGTNVSECFIDTGTSNTSLFINNCYCAGNTQIAFKFGELHYSSILNCCCDDAYIGFYFREGYGSSATINNCGCERIKNYCIYLNELNGGQFTINSFYIDKIADSFNEILHIENASNPSYINSIEFKNIIIRNVANNIYLVNHTSGNIVKIDSRNPHLELNSGSAVKQTQTIYKYLGDVSPNAKSAIAKISHNNSYGFIRLNLQMSTGIAAVGVNNYSIMVLINTSDNTSEVKTINEFYSQDRFKATFEFSLTDNTLYCTLNNSSSIGDTRIYIQSDSFCDCLLKEI